MMTLPRRGGQTVEITCAVDIEQTPYSLHAHAIPQGIDIRPGDIVLLHDAPARIGFGERISRQCRATVFRAGRLARMWTALSALLELTELYDVGFQPKETP